MSPPAKPTPPKSLPSPPKDANPERTQTRCLASLKAKEWVAAEAKRQGIKTLA
jgi:hypothetical protein